MSLSKRVVETLIDLVEIKLSCVEVYDREDKREIAGLERCRQELQKLLEGTPKLPLARNRAENPQVSGGVQPEGLPSGTSMPRLTPSRSASASYQRLTLG
jgi:hypothetical protein